MTILVNDEQLIGSLLPDPYVKSITLDSNPNIPPRKDNPHIAHPDENASAATSSSKPLTVTLDVVLKERLNASPLESWFYNQDFKKYLNLVVVQSTSPNVTNMLMQGNVLSIMKAPSKAASAALIFDNIAEELKKTGAQVTAAAMTADILNQLNAHTSSEIIYVGTDALKQQSVSTTDSGEKIIDFTYRFQFDAPSDAPQHLSYFVMSSLDLDQIAKDFGIDPSDTSLLELLNGKTILEKVIEGSQLISKAFVFKDEDDLIWTGPVTQNPDGSWVGGSRILTREIVTNNKIQDFRIYERIERLQLDFAYIENSQFNKDLPYKTSSNDQMDVRLSQNYFTNFKISKDLNDFRQFVFSVDYGKMIKDYSKYGTLYSSDDNALDILDNVRIRNISVLRRRITRSVPTLNQLGSPQENFSVFNPDVPVTVIARGQETVPGQKIAPGTESSLGVLNETDLELGTIITGVRDFEVVDLQISAVTDGYYQYGVEIEIEDNTEKLIKNKINQLLGAKNTLDEYYNLASVPYNPRTGKGNFDIPNNRFTDKFIQLYDDEVDMATEAILWYEQDPASGDTEIKTLSEQEAWQLALGGQNASITTPSDQTAPVIPLPHKPLAVYTDTLSFFNTSGASDTSGITEQLLSFINPRTGNPRGIMMVIKLIENLVTRLAKATGVSPGLSPDGSTIGISGKPIKTFKIQHYFKSTADSNEPKKIGYDYGVGDLTGGIDGFSQISLSEYKNRAKQESLKFYNSLVDDDINLAETELTYLTPSSVNLASRGNIDLMEEPFDPEKNLKIQTTLTGLNLTRKSPHLPIQKVNPKSTSSPSLMTIPQLEIKADLISAMANFNCTFETEDDLSRDRTVLTFESKDPFTDAGDIMGEEYEQVDQPTEKPDSIVTVPLKLEGAVDPTSFFAELLFSYTMTGQGSLNFFSDKTQMSPLSLESKKFIISTFDPNFYTLAGTVTGKAGMSIDPKTMSLLPNQIKSLFFKTNPGVKYNWGINMSLPAMSKAAFILNYKSIRTVEMLTGYDIDANGRPMLNAPIWKPLTNTLLGSGSGKRLCRMVKYENKELGCVDAIGMRMPVYNEYFIITGSEKKTMRKTKIKRIDRIRASINRNMSQNKHTRPEFLSTGLVSTKRINVTSALMKEVLEKVDLSPRKLK